MSRQYQYELWEECNNRCEFCYLGKDNLKTPTEIKIQHLQDLIKNISSEEIQSYYDNLSIIGGEFFQGQLNDPEVHKLFNEAIDIIFKFIDKDPENRSSWITATLTIGEQKDLYEILDKYKETESYKVNDEKTSNGLWICTSYDTKGRFHSDRMLDNWKKHMNNMTLLYPNVKKNTCMILSEDLMQKYNNGEFSFGSFCKEFGTQVFLKIPDEGQLATKQDMEKLCSNFFPRRETAMEFLYKVVYEEPWVIKQLMNVNLRSDELVKSLNDGNHEYCERHKDMKNEYGDDNVAPCGHSHYYSCYYDSDKCIRCDLAEILENME